MIAEKPMRKPRVLIVGGEDVDARIDVMRALASEFDFAAAGTARGLEVRFRQAGFAYHYFSLHRATAPMRDVRSFASLCGLLRQLRPAVVHTFDTKICVYGRLAARVVGVPAIVGTIPGLGSLYGDEPLGLVRRGVRRIYERLQAVASRHADVTVFQNADDMRTFIDKQVVPASKARLIAGSGVRTDVYDRDRIPLNDRRRLRAELGIPEDAVLVTMVSRVIRSKGVLEFARAAEQVRQEHPEARFLLVGAADEGSVDCLRRDELDALARAVMWPGRRSDVPVVLAASDVFVLPSAYREGIPRVLLEAAAMGLPIITTRSPGCSEVVEENRNGFLVPIRDPTMVVEALRPLLGDADLRRRFGRASRELAVRCFELKKIAAQTALLYREILSGVNELKATIREQDVREPAAVCPAGGSAYA